MRHRLSPRDTTMVAILGLITADDEAPSGGVVALARGCCETATSCRNRFGTAVSGTLNGSSARAWSAPELDSTSSNATTTPCLDVASVPSGNLDLNVSS